MAEKPPVLPPASASVPEVAPTTTITTNSGGEAEGASTTESRDADTIAALINAFKDNVKVCELSQYWLLLYYHLSLS